MKDLHVLIKDGKFYDIIFDIIPLKVANNQYRYVKTVKTIENEEKLLQSLTKLFLTNKNNHILGFGVDYNNISFEEIIRALTYYNNITDTDNPSELLEEIVELVQNNLNFNIKLLTKKGTTTTLSVEV